MRARLPVQPEGIDAPGSLTVLVFERDGALPGLSATAAPKTRL